MSEPFLGEIRMFGGNYAPVNWLLCSGQLLSVSENTALFSLIGTTYGGDGVQTFGLPNLQGRIPMHQGQGTGLQNYVLGQVAGTETVTITSATMPQHSHTLNASTVAANSTSPSNTALPGKLPPPENFYAVASGGTNPPLGAMNPASITMTQGGLPHDNMMPTLCFSFIICTAGIFPVHA